MSVQYLYRIPLPLQVEEYQVAQLYTVAEFSKQETGGSNGIEVLVNEPFDEKEHVPTEPLLGGQYNKGQYTLKNYYLKDKVPRLVKAWVDESYLTVAEEAWNAYPYCRTVIRNKGLSPQKFQIIIESLHCKEIDLENPHNLTPAQLKNLTQVTIDIGDNAYSDKMKVVRTEFDTNLYEKCETGPLKPKWYETFDKEKMMCAYKLVTITLNTFAGRTILGYIFPMEEKLFLDFHRKLFCYTHKWKGMTMEQIRVFEEETKKQLEQQFKEKELRGTTEK